MNSNQSPRGRCILALSLVVTSLLIIGALGTSLVSAAPAKPIFNPPGGTYFSPQSVTILATQGAIIRFTIDGSEPSATSTVYSTPILVSVTTTIKAKAFILTASSQTATATYTLKVYSPTFSPKADTYTAPQSITIKSNTPNAIIRYTTDGTTPSNLSTIYVDPIFVAKTATIRATAFVSGWTNSDPVSATYTINFPKIAKPTFNPAGGTYLSAQNVVLSCTTFDATIIYTTDGSDPSNSSNIYSGPILVSATTAIKAKAIKQYMTDSDIASETYTIKVAKPTFDPVGGIYLSPQNVVLSSDTPGAIIRFTTDNSEPTATSTRYSDPIPVGVTTTIKAKAFMTGMTSSDTASETYSIKVAAPTFNPTGGTYIGAQSVQIQSSTVGATIRFTTNGAEPTSSSPVYSTPIQVTVTTTIKAKAFATGMITSDTSSESYIIKIPTPTFDPPSDTYSSPLNVTIVCGTPGATIRYTSDGSEPSAGSRVYTSAILVSVSTTIKAKAFATNMITSDTASATYTIKVGTPTFSPSGGVYSSSQNVMLSTNTPNATIRYTLDGSEPNSASFTYANPITVSSTTTIKAKAFATNMTDSDTASATYDINIPAPTPGKVATPSFSPSGGSYSYGQYVTVQSTTLGATIRYTTNGAEPSTFSDVYSNAVFVTTTTTIRAKAFLNGLVDSDTASATYTITTKEPQGKVSLPTFSPAGGTFFSAQFVSIQCATSGATIRYTMFGEEPSSSSLIYSDPILIRVNTVIKAKAFISGMTASDTASMAYMFSENVSSSQPFFEYVTVNAVYIAIGLVVSIGLLTGVAFFWRRKTFSVIRR